MAFVNLTNSEPPRTAQYRPTNAIVATCAGAGAEVKTMAKMTLTTEHAASSYGIPVLVDEAGNAYGPDDKMPAIPGDPLAWLDETCAIAVLNFLAEADDYKRAHRDVQFVGSPLSLYHFARRAVPQMKED
jgi:hypothetical protein